jgi:DNA polymerase III delta prime subunit
MNSTFNIKYKPYFIKDFYLEPSHIEVLSVLKSMDDLNLLIVGNACSGKTSLMYAIIREYYGMNETATFPEYNIMMINNLKEQGIQFFRSDMKTFCQSKSSLPGKKKIIVVDDIDTINEQSQQVFRNYMDKYGKNVMFITICSNIQKVNESLQSRLHILKMNPMNTEHLIHTMNKIINNENILLDDAAKQYLISVSDNSIRVLINHLEKIHIVSSRLHGIQSGIQSGSSTPSTPLTPLVPLTMEYVQKLCSNISYAQFEKYIECLKTGELKSAIMILYEIYDYGYSVIDILDYLFMFIKLTKLLSETEKYQIIPYLCKYITIFHKVHEDAIELVFFTNNIYKIIQTH